MESAFKIIGQDKEVKEFMPDFDKLAALLVPKVVGDRLELVLKEEQVTALMLPLMQFPKSGAYRTDRIGGPEAPRGPAAGAHLLAAGPGRDAGLFTWPADRGLQLPRQAPACASDRQATFGKQPSGSG